MKGKLIPVLVLGVLTAATCPAQTCKPNELLLSGDCWPQVLNVGGRAVAPQVVWPKEVSRNLNGTPVWKCPSEYVLYLFCSMETCIPKELGPAQQQPAQSTPSAPVVVEQAKLAQDNPEAFARSYVDITQEQAWNAVSKAVREMSGVFGKKTDIPERKVEFEKNFPGLPRGKFVRFKVHIAQTTDGRIQVIATPTKVQGLPTYPLPSEAQMESLSAQFFGLVDREVGVYWSNATNQNATPSPFGSFRKSLIGINVIARTALPVWLEPDGETVFPTAFSKARTGDALTITNIVLCGRYPVREIESECGTEPVGDRLVVVVLFNGAQPRLLPSSPPVQGGDTSAAFGDTLDSLVCIFGRAIDCVQANQRTNVRELERLQGTMQHSSAEASWGMSELQKFQQTGPEIAFEMSSRDLSTQAGLSAVIRDHLSRFVEMEPAGISVSTAPTNITITSTPTGAEMYVDENFVGNTPSTVNVPSGRHSISVKKAGFRDWVREMNLSGGTITLVAELVPNSGTQP